MISPLIIFDLDGTLAESKQPMTGEVATLLAKLLAKTRVAVISGGALPQFLKQVVEQLPSDANLRNLSLLPTSGASLYEKSGADWKKIYEERISEFDAQKIEHALLAGAQETGLVDFQAPSYGPRIEYRGGQVSLSALGQLAPPAEKKKWDPDRSKRRALQEAIARRLPQGFQAAMGGSTTIDITKKSIDKAYGIRQLATRLGIPEQDILYVGDELAAHGNDEAVFKTDAKTKAVKNPADTVALIRAILARA